MAAPTIELMTRRGYEGLAALTLLQQPHSPRDAGGEQVQVLSVVLLIRFLQKKWQTKQNNTPLLFPFLSP